jgi:hypothetical protein
LSGSGTFGLSLALKCLLWVQWASPGSSRGPGGGSKGASWLSMAIEGCVGQGLGECRAVQGKGWQGRARIQQGQGSTGQRELRAGQRVVGGDCKAGQGEDRARQKVWWEQQGSSARVSNILTLLLPSCPAWSPCNALTSLSIHTAKHLPFPSLSLSNLTVPCPPITQGHSCVRTGKGRERAGHAQGRLRRGQGTGCQV